MADLPCDADGVCMACKVVPMDEHVLLCNSCTSPWHMQCLNPPLTSVPSGRWECPDCSMSVDPPPASVSASASLTRLGAVADSNPNAGPVPENDVVGMIRAIQADASLTEAEKARRRQALMAHQASPAQVETAGGQPKRGGRRNETLEMLDQNLNCAICMVLAERPVTTPCGHNFCLKCFQRWITQGKKTCVKCRAVIPTAMANQPRINLALVMAIRLANSASPSVGSHGPPKPYHHIDNDNRPDKCFTSERAVKTGKANACSGRIFVTVPLDHFGPILPENDPLRSRGVLVGDSWEGRMECRQWGAHFPHVAGIAGQADYGAQSVALSGGYEDDEDHGEWFLYTGSGGRDLSGNKRTSKEQSFDQKFDKVNEALRVSCRRGYPVRVVRSSKERKSSYAPEMGVRYDGVYRIEKCWRKTGIQGHKVCRYLFVRCDNEPAPWSSDEQGDRPRDFPPVNELENATDVFERKSPPSWEWKVESGIWGWSRDPPESRKTGGGGTGEKSSKRKQLNIQQKLLREFGCSLCRRVMQLPISTPCGHNFCKPCLVAVFSGKQDMRERTSIGGRSLRVQKVMKRCPACTADITDFINCPQVNRQMEDVILSLKSTIAEGDEEEQHSEGTEGKSDKVVATVKDLVAVAEIAEDSDEESHAPALLPSSLLYKSAGLDRRDENTVTDGTGEPIASGVVLSKTSAEQLLSRGTCIEMKQADHRSAVLLASHGPTVNDACGGSVVKEKGKRRSVEELSIPASRLKLKRSDISVKDTSDEPESGMQKKSNGLCHQVVPGSGGVETSSVRTSNGESRPAGRSTSLVAQDPDAAMPRRSWTRSQQTLALSPKPRGLGRSAADAIEL